MLQRFLICCKDGSVRPEVVEKAPPPTSRHRAGSRAHLRQSVQGHRRRVAPAAVPAASTAPSIRAGKDGRAKRLYCLVVCAEHAGAQEDHAGEGAGPARLGDVDRVALDDQDTSRIGIDKTVDLLKKPSLEQLARKSGYTLTWAEELPGPQGARHRGGRTIEVLAELPANDRFQVLIPWRKRRMPTFEMQLTMTLVVWSFGRFE